MKNTIVGAILGCAIGVAAGVGAAEGSKGLHPKTIENLTTAMRGEAFAHAKYLLYAKHARSAGRVAVAKEFETAANTERLSHFAEEADLLGFGADDAANLKDAIQGESYEVDTMYREFADQARQAGDIAASERFQEIRRDEAAHRDAFAALLAGVQKAPAVR